MDDTLHPVPCFIKVEGTTHQVTFAEWSEFTYKGELPNHLKTENMRD